MTEINSTALAHGDYAAHMSLKWSLVILIVGVSFCPVIVDADELDYLKELAAKSEMHYLGTTPDNDAYIFTGKNNTFEVLIPTGVADNREASLCFHAGVVSAQVTWDLKDLLDRQAFKAAMDAKESHIQAEQPPNP